MQETKKETKKISVFCKVCHTFRDITTPNQIFSGGKFAKYAWRCPECGTARPLPYEPVEMVFGEIKV